MIPLIVVEKIGERKAIVKKENLESWIETIEKHEKLIKSVGSSLSVMLGSSKGVDDLFNICKYIKGAKRVVVVVEKDEC
ncbi:hypothetical protein [Methanocaldococcus sp.]